MAQYGNQWWASAGAAGGAWDLSESDADSNTFVLEMENSTANGNETGAGFGLTGTNLVATRAGTVGAVDGDGYRTFTDGAMHFTSDWFNAWLPRDSTRITWNFGMLMKDLGTISNTDHSYFSWIGGTAGARADASMYFTHYSGGGTNMRAQIANNNAYPVANYHPTIDFGTIGSTQYVWFGVWSNGTYVRGGWVASDSEPDSPSEFADFPSTQRFSENYTGTGANYQYWNYSPLYFYSYGNGGQGIGFINGNARGNFKLKKFIASKLQLIED